MRLRRVSGGGGAAAALPAADGPGVEVEGWAEASVEQSLLKMVGRGFGGFNSTVPGTGRRGIFLE